MGIYWISRKFIEAQEIFEIYSKFLGGMRENLCFLCVFSPENFQEIYW